MVTSPIKGSYRITDDFKHHFDDLVQRAFPGTDFALKFREPIYAPEAGTVVRAKDKYGAKYIQLRTAQNWNRSHFLVHLDDYAVANMVKVKQGQLIGYAGHTGYLIGVKEALLHWGLKDGTIWLDPMTQVSNIIKPTPTMDGQYYNGAVAAGEGIVHQVKKAGYPSSFWTDTQACIDLFYKYNPQYKGKTLHPGDRYKLPVYKATRPAPEPVKDPMAEKIAALEQELAETKKKQLEELQKSELEKQKKIAEIQTTYDSEILKKDAEIDEINKQLTDLQNQLVNVQDEKAKLLDQAAVKLPAGVFESMESVQPLLKAAIDAELNSPEENTVKKAYNKIQTIQNPVIRSLLLYDWKYLLFFVLFAIVALLTVLQGVIPAHSAGILGVVFTVVAGASALGKLALDGVQRQLLATGDTNKDGKITIEDTQTYHEIIDIKSLDNVKK